MAALKTQGTQLYYASAATTVTTVASVMTATGLDAGANDQLDTTLLSASARTFISGLANPGAVTIEMLHDTLADPSVAMLRALKAAGTSVDWCIGLSDGTAPPTASASLIVQPAAASRSTVKFNGFVSGYVVDFPQNDVVKAQITIQTSGVHAWVDKV
jgi:hypothetical protein